MSFRCAIASGLRDEPLAGTASTVRPFLLVENPGPWGVDALRDSRMPAPVRGALLEAARATGVRVLLVRRHHRRAPRAGFRVFAAYADPEAPWAETTLLADSEELLELDLPALAAGRSPGLTPHPDPILCVCTHGRHDACCAERGRPVAAALAAAAADDAWECSHIGGDRFAGNVLVLPDGLYYGRLDPASTVALVGTHRSGHLDLDHFRGRSCWPMPVQAAEIWLRRELGESRRDALRLLQVARDGSVSRVRFDLAGTAYDLEVRSSPGPAELLTCQAVRGNPIPVHKVSLAE